MSARIVPIPCPSGDDVDLAWSAVRAFARAEADDPSLRFDGTHERARKRAKDEFERLYERWSAG